MSVFQDPDLRSVPITLSPAHLKALERRRRLVLQEDANMPFEALRLPFDKWLDFRFRHCDHPGSQIDGIWWDVGLAEDTYALYESRLLPRLRMEGFDDWCRQGIDWPAELVRACHARGLEAFWNNRVCPVDFPQPFHPGRRLPHDHPDRLNPIKQAHPDWVNPCWWPQGLWNLAVPDVRERKTAILRELLERCAFDGIQLDFARHTPCLPPGREWEFREHATAFVRSVRLMMLEVERVTGHPRLLAVRIGETVPGNHLDGFEVERWTEEDLVDILTLGGRTTTIDVAAFSELVRDHPARLCACFDGHHTTDGYYFPDADYFRAVFRNFRLQGVDTISLFNWACAPPDAYEEFGLPAVMKCASQTEMTRTAGSLDTLCGDRLYAVERRGGYPWAGNYVYRNEARPLPASVPENGQSLELPLFVYDDLATDDAIRGITLQLIVRGGDDQAVLTLLLNKTPLCELRRDPAWKDSQIYGDKPQPTAGSWTAYARTDPDQDLLRIECMAPRAAFRTGENAVSVSLPEGNVEGGPTPVIEKVEIRVRY